MAATTRQSSLISQGLRALSPTEFLSPIFNKHSIPNKSSSLTYTSIPSFDEHYKGSELKYAIRVEELSIPSNSNDSSEMKLQYQSGIQIQKGFGTFAPQEQSVLEELHNHYPPLSNAAYYLTRHGVDTRSRIRTPSDSPANDTDVIAFVEEWLHERKDADKQASIAMRPSMGELLAKDMNWDRRLFTSEEVFAPCGGTISISGARNTFVSAIDYAARCGQEAFQFCQKCKSRHIPVGPQATLQDRDKCLSMLPEWFPAEKFAKPWDAFIDLVNDLVRLDEIEKGVLDDPEGGIWNKQYHEITAEWRAVGRRGGWWRCRTGFEVGDIVPDVERSCSLCHEDMARVERETKESSIEDRKKKIEAWIEEHMKKSMAKDRATVEERFRTEGF